MQVNAVSGFIKQVDSLNLKNFQNTIIIHQLPHNPSNFKELAVHLSASQRIATSSYAAICWQLSSSELDNSQQMAACELMFVG